MKSVVRRCKRCPQGSAARRVWACGQARADRDRLQLQGRSALHGALQLPVNCCLTAARKGCRLPVMPRQASQPAGQLAGRAARSVLHVVLPLQQRCREVAGQGAQAGSGWEQALACSTDA